MFVKLYEYHEIYIILYIVHGQFGFRRANVLTMETLLEQILKFLFKASSISCC